MIKFSWKEKKSPELLVIRVWHLLSDTRIFIHYQRSCSVPRWSYLTSHIEFPFTTSFFCKHLNVEMREINKHEFPFFISLNRMGAINIEFPFTIFLYSIFYIFFEVGAINEYEIHSGRYLLEIFKNIGLSTHLNGSGLIFSLAFKHHWLQGNSWGKLLDIFLRDFLEKNESFYSC